MSSLAYRINVLAGWDLCSFDHSTCIFGSTELSTNGLLATGKVLVALILLFGSFL